MHHRVRSRFHPHRRRHPPPCATSSSRNRPRCPRRSPAKPPHPTPSSSSIPHSSAASNFDLLTPHVVYHLSHSASYLSTRARIVGRAPRLAWCASPLSGSPPYNLPHARPTSPHSRVRVHPSTLYVISQPPRARRRGDARARRVPRRSARPLASPRRAHLQLDAPTPRRAMRRAMTTTRRHRAGAEAPARPRSRARAPRRRPSARSRMPRRERCCRPLCQSRVGARARRRRRRRRRWREMHHRDARSRRIP